MKERHHCVYLHFKFDLYYIKQYFAAFPIYFMLNMGERAYAHECVHVNNSIFFVSSVKELFE